MSTKYTIILFFTMILLAIFGFFATGFVQRRVQQLHAIETRLTLLESKTGNSIQPIATTQISGEVAYQFECDKPGLSSRKTALYRLNADGSKTLIADGIEKLVSNEHPGDCFDVVASDAGNRFDQAKKLYLLQVSYGDAGVDGYFEYDLGTKTLSRSRIEAPFNFSSVSADKRYALAFTNEDAQNEVRSLELIDFTNGTTSTVAKLSNQYSYVNVKHSNELEGGVNVYGDVHWVSWRVDVAVYSAQDGVRVCQSSASSSLESFSSCKKRVPVFVLELDLSNPEKEVK